jgi:hypothetical protein
MLVINKILTFTVDAKSISYPKSDHSEDFGLVGLCLQVLLVAIFPLFSGSFGSN